MDRRQFLKVTGAGIFVMAGGSILAAENSPSKPNVVFILADDLGYMDIGANNPKTFYETPNIDRFAASGMRFTSGYAACPVCSPTRASIMTGKYPPRTGITDFIVYGGAKTDHLALAEVTLAEALRDAGYATFVAGKWHLGIGEYSPNAQGFGPGLVKIGSFYYPKSADPLPNPKDDPKTTDCIADEAVRFIAAHTNNGNQGGSPFGAARDGDWKLIEWYKDGSLELHNLREDIGENNNLIKTRGDIARELHEKLIAWRKDVGAVMH